MDNKHLKKLDKLLKKAKLDKLKSKDFKRYGSARKLYNFKIDLIKLTSLIQLPWNKEVGLVGFRFMDEW